MDLRREAIGEGPSLGSVGPIAKSTRPPRPAPEQDAARLLDLLRGQPLTEGLYVRPLGKDLAVGRPEWMGRGGKQEDDDRLRLKGLGDGCYLIQARLSTGRYEVTGLAGDIDEIAQHLLGPLRHYLGPWTKPARGPRTSGRRY